MARADWLGVAVLTLVFVALSAWTWNTWADPLVDFGRELQAATRLARGETLYRDVAYLNGPLSPYFNAMLLQLGGASLKTLFLANRLVLAGCATLLWVITRRLAGGLSAFVCTALLVGLCGFLTLGEVGNYNFVAPYSHEMTHGLLLSLAAFRLLIALLDRPRAWLAPLLGVFTGLTLLTKPEIAIATLGAVVTGVLLRHRFARAGPTDERAIDAAGPKPARWIVPAVLLGVSSVILLAWSLLVTGGLSGGEAWRGVLGAWPGTFDRALHALPFYRTVAGTSDLSRAMSLMALSAAGWAFVALLGMALAGLAACRGWSVRWTSAVLAAALLIFAMAFTSPGHWQVAFRGAGVMVLVAMAALAWSGLNRPGLACLGAEEIGRVPHGSGPAQSQPAPSEPAGSGRFGSEQARPGLERSSQRSRDLPTVPRLAFCAFAILLLLKVRFNVNLTHYGFVLALPAVCVLAMSLLDWLPSWLERNGRSGWPVRSMTLATFACVFAVYLHVAATFLADRVPIAASGNNELWVPRRRAQAILRLLSQIEARVPPDATLTVLPEGALIHAWSGRRSALPYTTLMPVEMSVFGEDRVLAAFERCPPDFVILNRTADLNAYGHDGLPSYAPRLAGFLRARYEQVLPGDAGDELLLLKRLGR